MNRLIAVMLGLAVALGAAAFFVFQEKKKQDDDPISTRPGEAASRDPGHAPAELEALQEENRTLRRRVRELEAHIEVLEADERSGGVPRPGSAPSREAGVARPSGPGAGTSGEASGARPAEKEVTLASLAAEVVDLMRLAKEAEDGNKPSPELMRVVSRFMGEVAQVQEAMGFEEPGYVTEAPLFQAHAVAAALEETDTPLNEAERAGLMEAAGRAMGPYVEAAKGREDGFALEKIAGVMEVTDDFEKEMAQRIGDRDFENLPFSFSGKGGRAESTDWPEQSRVGVKDVKEAVDSITSRWSRKMGIPSFEEPALRAIAREYVERTHATKTRLGVTGQEEMNASTRRDLDRQIASAQVDALRRIHDSLNLDEKTREKVRAYRSLDRFLLGGSGSWSRSGSFGGFQMSTSREERRTREE